MAVEQGGQATTRRGEASGHIRQLLGRDEIEGLRDREDERKAVC